jgi:hypothetical protein
LADATLFIAIASLLSVFDIKKGNGTDVGPDPYPYTGNGLKCGHRVLLVVPGRLGELTIGVFFLAFRSLSPALSFQGTGGQKSLLMPIHRHNATEQVVCLSCIPFLCGSRLCCY